MAYANVLDDIPSQITAGESVSWTRSLSKYPAGDGWVMDYVLVDAAGQIELPTSTADGDTHVIEVPLATSAGYASGEYTYAAYVSDGTERYKIDEGYVTVLVDFAEQTTGYDARSHIRKTIDALEASIEGRASKTQLEHEIDGVQIKHIPIGDQMDALDRYKARVRTKPNGEQFGETVDACLGIW